MEKEKDESRLSEFMKHAYAHGRVKDVEEAFKEYPVEEEWHQGKAEAITIEQIVRKNENRIKQDLSEIKGIKFIDFIDMFPLSEEHREFLDKEAQKISKQIDETEKGRFYLLNKPFKTYWGELKFLKIRFYDETKLNWEAAADFAVEDWNYLKNRCLKDNRFTYIEREKWEAVEFKTSNSLVYFLNPLVTEVYNIK